MAIKSGKDLQKFLDSVNLTIEKQQMVVKKAKQKKKEKTGCKNCGLTPIYVRGLCKSCHLGDREIKEAAKVGKRWTSTNGYEYTYVEGGKVALYHRVLMEKILGRPLEKHEKVKHKNGIKNDNRPDNLVLYSEEGIDLSTLICPTCNESLAQKFS